MGQQNNGAGKKRKLALVNALDNSKLHLTKTEKCGIIGGCEE